MKSKNWLMMFLLAAVVAVAGCGKKEVPPPAPQGVTVDVPKLREAFANASPECQTAVSEVAMGVRYNDCPSAFKALAKLDSAPGVTEAQKKVITTVTEQVKQLASKSTGPSAR